MLQTQIIVKGNLSKVDKARRCAYGWGYVYKENGEEVIDHSEQSINDEEMLVKAVHDFVSECRVGGETHIKKGVAELVESIVFTETLQKALGIDLGKCGWFVGFRILDDDVLEKIEKGDYQMFSIGGTGILEEVK